MNPLIPILNKPMDDLHAQLAAATAENEKLRRAVEALEDSVSGPLAVYRYKGRWFWALEDGRQATAGYPAAAEAALAGLEELENANKENP